MATIKVLNQSGQPAGDLEVSDGVFATTASTALVHQAVIAEQASWRSGTHKAKTRAEVSGGGRKPWRQKGTGRARQGSTRAPHWRHGGVTFGPVPRDHSVKLNRKMHEKAIRGVLSNRVETTLRVVDSLAVPSGKTKDMIALLNSINAVGKVLFVFDDEFVLSEAFDPTFRSLRNLPNVIDFALSDDLSVYDLLNANAIVATKAAIETIGEVYAK
ncbi:MAG TPA: 50S ribosomal protein L4 [Armatimonadota bacterium]|jgi:large subunit ribosomal protein L4